MIDLATLTISKARNALDTREFSAVDLAQAYLAEIEKKDPTLHAYLEVFDDVIAQAEAADRRIQAGEGKTNTLLGIPLAIKDNILIRGRHASSASKMLENYVASYDATVIEKLKAAGVVFLGRTNMDEFALGGSTENSAFGVTRNPYDKSRVAGGTSGGSAAAVAANLCLAALGSDTGGSIRQPASFCGVVGFKPTYGAVSRNGLMAAVSSFDCIGPIAKTVEDAEIIFNCIRGQDPLDSTTISENTYEQVHENVKDDKKNDRKTVGVLTTLMNQDGIDPTVRENFDHAVERFRERGFNVVDIEIPNISYCLALYYILNFAEVSSNLARFDGVKYGLHVDGKDLLEDYMFSKGEGFGPETRRRILLGTYVLSSGYYDAYYGKAQSAREMLKKEFANVFRNVDFILTPTSPFPAWVIGEKSDPLAAYLADIFTVTANIVGVPAVSLPSGFTEKLPKGLPKGLPLGIQLMAAHGNEQGLFDTGKEFTRLA